MTMTEPGVVLECRRCHERKTFPADATYDGLGIAEWFDRQGLLCTACRELRAADEAAQQVTAAATEAAIAQADANADERWKQVALSAIRHLAEHYDEFTADEVWHLLDDVANLAVTHEPAALGPVFLRAARSGWIANTGRRRKRSVYARRHRELTIWGSLLRGRSCDG